MTERDRNPDILATADRLAEMTGGLEYRRDAIYDALASSSASGAGQMREAVLSVPGLGSMLADAIRALPLPDPAPAWLPIETAPKDATRIIVTDGLGVYGWAWWNETEGVWLNCDGCHPTQWQPLPPPPQTGDHDDA